MEPAPLASAAAAESGSRLKLLTLNTHKGFTSFNRRFVLHELREAVTQAAADIVCLQEVLGSHERHQAAYPTWPAEPQYQFLAGAIWGHFAYGRNAVYTEGHHGNAVLSKYPIVRYDNHDISVGAAEQRGLLHCVLQLPAPAGELHVVCTHLALGEAARGEQVQRLCALVETIPADTPLVVAGDFNDWRNRANARLLQCSGIREAFIESRGRTARTFPARLPLLKLDRIYFRNAGLAQTQVLSARPWSHLSDHAALVAEFAL